MFPTVCRLAGVMCLMTALACSDSSTGPSPLNLTGNWNGTLVRPPLTLAIAWAANQSGANVTGPASYTLTGVATVTGTISGTVNGSQLAMTATIPAGALTPFDPTLSTCSMTATGTLAATSTSLSGPVTATWTQACVGKVVATATQTDQLSLTK